MMMAMLSRPLDPRMAMFLAPEIIQHGVRWKKHQRRLGSANMI
jgi:hypothetical protein